MLKIERVVIHGFWGNRTFDMHFDSDVNIFSGINGSGKTTILDILYSILKGSQNLYQINNKYHDADIYFSDGYRIHAEEKENEKELSYFHNERLINRSDISALFQTFAVSSFDSNPLPNAIQEQLRERNPWIVTELDYKLANSLVKYHKYKSSISTQIELLLGEKNVKVKELRAHFDRSVKMRDICDEFFSPTLEWNKLESDVQFVLKEDPSKSILPKDLSSGEKQMLILLISTLLQEQQECIVFWDEPEISLHIDWQHILIRKMREINPNMQLIIATHSPSLIYEGWERRVINIEKVLRHE